MGRNQTHKLKTQGLGVYNFGRDWQLPEPDNYLSPIVRKYLKAKNNGFNNLSFELYINAVADAIRELISEIRKKGYTLHRVMVDVVAKNHYRVLTIVDECDYLHSGFIGIYDFTAGLEQKNKPFIRSPLEISFSFCWQSEHIDTDEIIANGYSLTFNINQS